ncbi:MAG: cytochrome c [Spirochaetaceae bacterium]|nr:cytochrome c [Myxococcales bacterium]MCB9724801.1 cytochrome c [Spirochaetaceae bacterium]HPG28146.1 cytochrome c [Myxococcota bacterium]
MNVRPLGMIGLLACLPLLALGCGGDDDPFAGESATTRAIRLKVEKDLEADRLKRLAPRIAAATEAAASSPTAVVAAPAEGDHAESAGARPADELYAQNCASCHGPTGRGDGPLSAGLVPAPAKHADGNYMNPLTNDYLFRVVKEGGAAVGKSAMMAPWGTSMSDEEIRGLVAHMRTLAEPAYEGPMP